MFLLNISRGIAMDQKLPNVTRLPKSYTCKDSFPAKSVFKKNKEIKKRMIEGKELTSFHN